MRPVPTVFLRLALSDQLSGEGVSTMVVNVESYIRQTYTCGSWRWGNRRRHTPSSERSKSGDLLIAKSVQLFRVIQPGILCSKTEAGLLMRTASSLSFEVFAVAEVQYGT